MGVAWYIVLEKKIPGFDPAVNGRALARAEKILGTLATELGVPGLMQFFSAAPEELAGFAEDHGVDLESKGIILAAEKWFPAEDGLRTVRALIQAGERNRVSQPDPIMGDLKEFENVLEIAQRDDVRWHLAIDY